MMYALSRLRFFPCFLFPLFSSSFLFFFLNLRRGEGFVTGKGGLSVLRHVPPPVRERVSVYVPALPCAGWEEVFPSREARGSA